MFKAVSVFLIVLGLSPLASADSFRCMAEWTDNDGVHYDITFFGERSERGRLASFKYEMLAHHGLLLAAPMKVVSFKHADQRSLNIAVRSTESRVPNTQIQAIYDPRTNNYIGKISMEGGSGHIDLDIRCVFLRAI
jgi:hypothetical protein